MRYAAVSSVSDAGTHSRDGGARITTPATDSHFNCDTKSLVEVVPTIEEGTTRVTG